MTPATSQKLIDEIATSIRTKIVSGAYAPGQRLKQEMLAEEFGVSRTPIREALSRLQAQGLVAQEQRRSAVVSTPSPRDIAETFQIRAELEGLAAGLAARWISDEALDRLRASHDRFIRVIDTLRAAQKGAKPRRPAARRKDGPLEWAAMNAEFHDLIAAASSNRNLERMIAEMRAGYTGAAVATAVIAMDLTRLEGLARHHGAILAALEKRDAARARRLMIEHVLEAASYVVTWFENKAH
ncbi:GntR family transcriptional regulator [Aquabacter spiritensis]|uniref:GntR family transcriptional regulator n=1 Tax=Aquabacter spiritensis TaxID=933073 RepID=A0A4R3LUR1_9HYPH|nr:GntR family transcriptional regulator [Aquabacter spiritensis]TCT04340.1 GntR family transcriptional regulator [Aquabacter spiritensis]